MLLLAFGLTGFAGFCSPVPAFSHASGPGMGCSATSRGPEGPRPEGLPQRLDGVEFQGAGQASHHGPRRRYAFQLLRAFGLRPEELQHLLLRQGLLWCTY